MKQSLILSYLLIFLLSCSAEQREQVPGSYTDTTDEQDITAVPQTHEPSAPPEYELEKGSKIIKKGTLHFDVGNLQASKEKIDSLVQYFNSYYENQQYHSYSNSIGYSLKLRIPNAKFEGIVAALEEGLGTLLSKSIHAQDVTEEYVDLNIRLENNLAYVSQYQEILKKATTIEEILDVQERIRRIEEEIDSKKGRLRFLEDQVKYATLQVEITEILTEEAIVGNGFGFRIKKAFLNGFQGLLSFLVVLVNLWPLFLFLIPILVFRKNFLPFGRK